MTRLRTAPRRVEVLAAALAALMAALAGCGGATPEGAAAAGSAISPAPVRSYIAAVERIRLPVNALLEHADPILQGYQSHRLPPAAAGQRLSRLELSFADYLLAMQQITPATPALRALNAPYARTYFLEDSYLATLASDLRDGSFDNLPDTQGAQRLAIVIWRTRLAQLAARAGVSLPADLQQAGRGEIAPTIDDAG